MTNEEGLNYILDDASINILDYYYNFFKTNLQTEV